jgi:plastocyanin domain-containing protein
MRFVVLALALASVASVAACSNKDGAPSAAAGVVPIVVDADGFKPSSVKFAKGAQATLVFTRTTDDTCATEVDFPELKVKKALPKGTPVSITVPTDKEQTLTFQCGMGMYKSSVVISAK